VFEDGDVGRGDLMFFMEYVKRQSPTLAGIYPQFKTKDHESLQACDFLAWEPRYLVKKRLTNQDDYFRQSFNDLLTLKRDWGVSDRQTLEKWVHFIDVPTRTTMMSKRDLSKWRPKPLRRPRPQE